MRGVIFFLCGWLGCGALHAVHYGQSKAELLVELGPPNSALARGAREILLYPQGGRVELVEGKVALVQGLPVSEAPSAEVAGATVVEPAKPTGETSEAESAATALMQAAEARAEAAVSAPADAMRTEMERALDRLENGPGPDAALARPAFEWRAFLVGLVVKWGLMVVALKLTCKYWAVQVEWPGLLLAALVDAGVRAVVLLVTEHGLGLPSAFMADEALGALALVLVLKKVSINQSTAQAVQITITSKVFSVVVGSFLSVVVLRALL